MLFIAFLVGRDQGKRAELVLLLVFEDVLDGDAAGVYWGLGENVGVGLIHFLIVIFCKEI